ncbi:MAG TPA: hypothetical protein DEP18_08965 [Flavobacteriales bacterium]|nr:hypothetical protein [Flavobacteriales bacterium]HRE74847.1 histidine kinase dimerization/phosphoacceptor domain -containing protein [Flavobacteriales bacterium]HRJ37929.1 histidine kinase dimerization/phosphoacceptor domain -containing protein [Flavobacteriales bacterium]
MNFIGIIEQLMKSPAIHKGNRDRAILEILVKSAQGLQVERVNVWTFDKQKTTLSCIGSYESSTGEFNKGAVLLLKDYPVYFEHVRTAEKVISDDALASSFNKELLDSYILPLDIRSMMDIPIRSEGEMIGMVCFEQVGEKHLWTVSEQSFALSIAQLFSLVFETHEKNEFRRQLEEALHEKEVLLSEVNHRVKNNMMIIGSLVNLQKYKAKDEYHVGLFDEVRERITSMAYVHEQLYLSRNYSEIDFGLYLEKLLNHLLSSMRHGRNIRIETHLEHIPIDIQRAIPCGLITNELVTNSFKYAFEHQNEGTIQVEFLKKNGQLHLNFADNGKGFDPQKIEKNSVGLGLVEDLVQQLNGELHISGNSGARFEMAFPA